MSWNSVPEDVRERAQASLTEKQLAALKLELAGLSLRAIAHHLDLARQTAADRIESAHRAMRRAGIHQDASGRWSIRPVVAATLVSPPDDA